MTLWGGGFAETPDAALWAFTVDTSDRRLLVHDIRGSIAHVAGLGRVGLLDQTETTTIADGLVSILGEAEAGDFVWLETDEDVHTAVERRLHEVIGDVAGKLHTGRSRNDQVALDIRMYLRKAGNDRIHQIESFARCLVAKAQEVGETIVASYTHVQQAQAVPLAHHLLAYAWMFVRDVDRFRRAVERLSVSPLGAGASGGSSLPLDPAGTARDLGFDVVFANSMDAVGARDFAAEYAFCCAQTMVHLSRLSEELVLWSSEEFSWARYADRHTTGSSALPQKKNADIAELARGKAATVIGDVTALLALQKGLPLTYNRDLQEDKRALFHADDTLALALEALTAMVSGAVFDPPPPSSWVTALDLAEVLVTRGVPFRVAHEAVGILVSRLIEEGRTLAEVTFADLGAAHEKFVADDVSRVDPRASVLARISPGGGSFVSTLRQSEALQALLGPG